MQVEDLKSLLRCRPFRPFRITFTTQEEFDISHPDLAIVSESFIAVGLPKLNLKPSSLDSIVWIDLQPIVHIQPIDHSDVPF